MKAYKIIWTKNAINARARLIRWYWENTSPQFVDTIEKNLAKIEELLSYSPGIGRKERIENNKVFRSFLAHPKTRIFYWYDDKEIHIQHLISTMMNY